MDVQEKDSPITRSQRVILILSDSERRLENLQAILRNLPGDWLTIGVRHLDDCRSLLEEKMPIMVIIDYKLEPKMMDQILVDIRNTNGQVWILQLATYPQEYAQMTNLSRPDKVLSGDISSLQITNAILKAEEMLFKRL